MTFMTTWFQIQIHKAHQKPSPLEETLLDFSMYGFYISLPYEVGSPLGPLAFLTSQKARGLEEKIVNWIFTFFTKYKSYHRYLLFTINIIYCQSSFLEISEDDFRRRPSKVSLLRLRSFQCYSPNLLGEGDEEGGGECDRYRDRDRDRDREGDREGEERKGDGKVIKTEMEE